MIFSVLAFIAVIVSICIKDIKKSLVVQSLNCICEAIYDFIISAFGRKCYIVYTKNTKI